MKELNEKLEAMAIRIVANLFSETDEQARERLEELIEENQNE